MNARLVIAAPAVSPCQTPVTTRVNPVMVQMMMVSKKVPVMQTNPCSTHESVLAAAAAIGAEPRPDSLEKTPRATPACSASMMVAPAKPPVAAVVLNADDSTELTAAGSNSAFMPRTARQAMM